MLKQSTLTNKLNETYDQTINGKRYVIKPGETVTLNRNEAVDVKGHYLGHDKKVCLEIKHLPDGDDAPAQPNRIYCAPDGKEFASKQELQDYIRRK